MQLCAGIQWSGSEAKTCSVKYVPGWKDYAMSLNELRTNCACGLSFYIRSLMKTTLALGHGRRLLEDWAKARI